MALHRIDLLIIVVYLVGITGIGIWFSRHQRDSSSGYFLASRSLSWVTVGLALFATNISTVHLTGLAGAGFSDGLVFGNFEWLAPFLLILLGLVFAPFYFQTGVATLPEYLEGRYGPASRTVLAIMAVVGALFIHIGVTIYAGAEVMKQIVPLPTPSWWAPMSSYLDFNITVAIAIVSLLTILYTALGGLKAVVVTESIQTVLLLLGAAAVTGFGLQRLAEQDTRSLSDLHRACLRQQTLDVSQLADRCFAAAATFEAVVEELGENQSGAIHEGLRRIQEDEALRASIVSALDSLDQTALPPTEQESLSRYLSLDDSPGVPFSVTDAMNCAAALQSLGTVQQQRQEVLQRNAESANPHSSKLSMIRTEGAYTWWIMLLGYPVLGVWYWCADQTIVQRVLGARSERDAQIGPIFAGFIKILPVFLMVLPGVIGYVLFREEIGENADSTLSVLILNLLPRGMQGLVLAGLLAAMMSTVAGALNSVATLVSIDIVKRIWPETNDRTLVRIGQATAVVVMLVAVIWSTQGGRFGGIFAGINQMISVLAPPISVVFLWGIFWRRGTATAALTTLVVGFVVGMIVFVLDFPAFGLQWITQQLGLPFLLQAWILFVFCSGVHVAVSLITPAPSDRQVEQYCWPNPLAVITRQPIRDCFDPRILSAILVLLIATLYAVFA